MPIDTTFRINGRSLVRTVFVETGYYLGETAWAADAAGFEEVRSVEVSQEFLDRYYAGPKNPRIEVFRGASPDVLPEILEPEVPTTIYLDAHYMGRGHGLPEMKYGECPLLPELEAIFAVPWVVRPIVVVDDVHMLRRPWNSDLTSRFNIHQWPTRRQVVKVFGGYELIETEHVLYAIPQS